MRWLIMPLQSLDPQLICYSGATGISDVSLVVFVRKHQPEIRYLKPPFLINSALILLA